MFFFLECGANQHYEHTTCTCICNPGYDRNEQGACIDNNGTTSVENDFYDTFSSIIKFYIIH